MGGCCGMHEEGNAGNIGYECCEKEACFCNAKHPCGDCSEDTSQFALVGDGKPAAQGEDDNGDDEDRQFSDSDGKRRYCDVEVSQRLREVRCRSQEDTFDALDRDDGDVRGNDDLQRFVLPDDEAIGNDERDKRCDEEVPAEGERHGFYRNSYFVFRISYLLKGRHALFQNPIYAILYPSYCICMRHGFLLINKPCGPTSHDIVATVRRTLCERNVGHLGTLDPAAEGLLVLAVGAKALKVVELFTVLSKEYIAMVKLGWVSTTYDREGVLTEAPPKPGWTVPEEATVQRIIRDRFIGRIAQVPPAASAIRIGGERAYRKMRQGRAVDLPARDVTISTCAIQSYRHPHLSLRVACGSGTYIRSLAHDLGEALRCGGYLAALTRTRVGEWKLEDAVAPEESRWTDVRPLKDVLWGFPSVTITSAQAEDLRHGCDIDHAITEQSIAWHEGLPVAILVPVAEGRAHARKVL